MNIWFNRWFSTVSHYIELIKNNPEGKEVKIYGSYPNKDTVYFQYCDEWEVEPDIKGIDYINYCLDFCIRNEIDVFIPRKENVLISKELSKFTEIGVKVLVCHNSELIEMMDNKVAMYEDLEDKLKDGIDIVTVPEYKVVNNLKDFEIAYNEMIEKGLNVCIKPVIGEGAVGFRVIDNKVENLNYLLKTSMSQRISFNQLKLILGSVESFPDLMVLEYLEGPEYSIDCLADSNGNLSLAIPRKKGNGRIRILEDNKELLDIANKMANIYKIPFVYNIQVRYSNGIPKLLEINPRMSGGMHISCLAGVNIPYYALKYLLDEEPDTDFKVNFGIKATHIEIPIVLN